LSEHRARPPRDNLMRAVVARRRAARRQQQRHGSGDGRPLRPLQRVDRDRLVLRGQLPRAVRPGRVQEDDARAARLDARALPARHGPPDRRQAARPDPHTRGGRGGRRVRGAAARRSLRARPGAAGPARRAVRRQLPLQRDPRGVERRARAVRLQPEGPAGAHRQGGARPEFGPVTFPPTRAPPPASARCAPPTSHSES
jgi:hypothetical protein